MVKAFLTRAGVRRARYRLVKVSAPLTICLLALHGTHPDTYNLKRMRAAFSENMARIRRKLETKSAVNANDSFRCVC
jgi:hypothetical protein